MRDAFGGIFMIRLLLVFMFIYVAFSAVSLNYAKAFRIKNNIIDLIEKQEILDLETFYNDGTGQYLNSLNEILNNAQYGKICHGGNGLRRNTEGQVKNLCYNGIVIEQIDAVNELKYNDDNAIYYRIYTWADWNLGALNLLLRVGDLEEERTDVHGTWKISGIAKVRKR